MDWASSGTALTSKSRFSSLASTQGSELWRVIGLKRSPSTGSALIRPIAGRSAEPTRAMARMMSYSSRRSRSGDSAGIACLRSSWLTARPR